MGLEMISVGWLSIVPPLIAILLALLTKEVYSSLFIGVLSGMFIYASVSGISFITAIQYVFDMITTKIGDNSYMILFLSLLGALVVVVTMAGGSKAYGQWASKHLKNAKSAKLATVVLGILIFIDDYFNCLTVGTVMQPITDKFHISREKLAYLIDSTAAPICITAPISSWAVAVSSELGEVGGMNAFMATIPFNLYAILTIIMVFYMCFSNHDFGLMKKAESKSEIYEEENKDITEMDGIKVSPNGRVSDLVIPMVVLVISSILGMAYVGGFFSGTSFGVAIGEAPTTGLALGAFAALLTCLVMYIPRKLMTFKQYMEGISEGIKSMVPAIMILALAWSLSGVCRELIGTGQFVSQLVSESNIPFALLPAIVFAVAAFLSFSMGTAWGTFGILIPIVTMICSHGAGAELLIPVLGATLAGSVYGDHCSPISDTTILSSTGAKCNHIDHVRTQIPYATLVAVISFAGYIVAGITANAIVTLVFSIGLLFISFKIIEYKKL